ncbi:MAG: hypothetical protein JXM70_21605 [Pirellulales bacterium]|nr:hypothetical protein [Pirellulales bacterium]
MKSIGIRIVDAVVLHLSVIGSWAIIEIVRRRYGRLQRAIQSFEATYQFTAGSAVRSLTFSKGHVETKYGPVTSPDYELILLDPLAVARQIAINPNDIFKLMVENKIEQRGNNYFLFRYGYLLGLSRRYFEDLLTAITAPIFPKRKHNGP